MSSVDDHTSWNLECKVYVGGLSHDGTSQKGLLDLFGHFGRINNIWVARKPPGFAFIEFAARFDAEASARHLNSTMFHGRRLKVQMSTGESRWRKWDLPRPQTLDPVSKEALFDSLPKIRAASRKETHDRPRSNSDSPPVRHDTDYSVPYSLRSSAKSKSSIHTTAPRSRSRSPISAKHPRYSSTDYSPYRSGTPTKVKHKLDNHKRRRPSGGSLDSMPASEGDSGTEMNTDRLASRSCSECLCVCHSVVKRSVGVQVSQTDFRSDKSTDSTVQSIGKNLINGGPVQDIEKYHSGQTRSCESKKQNDAVLEVETTKEEQTAQEDIVPYKLEETSDIDSECSYADTIEAMYRQYEQELNEERCNKLVVQDAVNSGEKLQEYSISNQVDDDNDDDDTQMDSDAEYEICDEVEEIIEEIDVEDEEYNDDR